MVVNGNYSFAVYSGHVWAVRLFPIDLDHPSQLDAPPGYTNVNYNTFSPPVIGEIVETAFIEFDTRRKTKLHRPKTVTPTPQNRQNEL